MLWEGNVSDLNVLSPNHLVAQADNLKMFFSWNEQVVAAVSTATVWLEPLGAFGWGIKAAMMTASTGINSDQLLGLACWKFFTFFLVNLSTCCDFSSTWNPSLDFYTILYSFFSFGFYKCSANLHNSLHLKGERKGEKVKNLFSASEKHRFSSNFQFRIPEFSLYYLPTRLHLSPNWKKGEVRC